MSLIFFPMSIGFMSHVDLKKCQCRPVEFKGQGPHYWALVTESDKDDVSGDVTSHGNALCVCDVVRTMSRF